MNKHIDWFDELDVDELVSHPNQGNPKARGVVRMPMEQTITLPDNEGAWSDGTRFTWGPVSGTICGELTEEGQEMMREQFGPWSPALHGERDCSAWVDDLVAWIEWVRSNSVLFINDPQIGD